MIKLEVGQSWLMTWGDPKLPNDLIESLLPLTWTCHDEYGNDVLVREPRYTHPIKVIVIGHSPGFARVHCATRTGFASSWSDYFEITSKPPEITLPPDAYEWKPYRGTQFRPTYRSGSLPRFTDIRGI
jgi:hypothetical protein